MKKLKPGYYADATDDLWLIYPCGKKEYMSETSKVWIRWGLPEVLLAVFKLEFLGDL